jgi:diguanylate cyclase (GGDEF)-like protein/PAS domain S-box-containing protein
MCKAGEFFQDEHANKINFFESNSNEKELGVKCFAKVEKLEECLIFNLIPFPVWVLNLRGELIYFNKAFKVTWGLTNGSGMKGGNLKEIVSKSFINSCFVLSEQVLKEKNKAEDGYWVMDSQGEQKFFNVKALPYLNNHKEVEFIVFSAVDCTHFKKDNEKIKRDGQTDPLTGLFNRSAFDQKMTLIEKDKVFPLVLAIVDVDNLKKVNDEYGHLAGDDLIKACGNILKEVFRKDDFIANIGGDEFCVILTDCDVKTVKKRIRRIELEKDRIKNTFKTEFSLGWDHKRSKKESVWEVFKRADENMYRQKTSKKRGGV